jgi:hypothetical protein
MGKKEKKKLEKRRTAASASGGFQWEQDEGSEIIHFLRKF